MVIYYQHVGVGEETRSPSQAGKQQSMVWRRKTALVKNFCKAQCPDGVQQHPQMVKSCPA